MENQTLSPLQVQFPLSPKKFWKKVLGSLIGCSLLVIVFLVAAVIAQVAAVWEIFLGVFIVVLIYYFLRAWYIKVYIARYFYSASDDFVTIKKGVFAPAEIHVQYPKIQDVYVDQDIIDRIMGIYDVHIASATATSGIEAHIDGVDEAAADGLKTLLLNKIRGGGQSGTSQGAATSTSQAAPAQQKPLDQSQMISSAQYPISSKWMGMQVLAAFVHALWLSALVSLYLIHPDDSAWTVNVVIALVAFAVIFLCQIGYNAIWRKNFYFAFLPDYIQFSTQVIAKSEQHMPYRTVQDVIVKQGVIERFFGLATVVIQNAVNQPVRGQRGPRGISIPGQTPENANKIVDIVRSISLTRSSAATGL